MHIMLCDTDLLADYDALNATHPQTIPQAVDNLGNSNTKCCARVEKRDPVPSQGSGGREIWVSFATRRMGLFVHVQLVRLSGADVRGGSLAPSSAFRPRTCSTVSRALRLPLGGRLDGISAVAGAIASIPLSGASCPLVRRVGRSRC
jgi:hypothetical protein